MIGMGILGAVYAGVTAGIIATLESGVSFGQFVGAGAVFGAVTAVTFLLSHSYRYVVGGRGGLVTEGIVNPQTNAGSAAPEKGKMLQQAAIVTEAERFGYLVDSKKNARTYIRIVHAMHKDDYTNESSTQRKEQETDVDKNPDEDCQMQSFSLSNEAAQSNECHGANECHGTNRYGTSEPLEAEYLEKKKSIP